MQSILFLGECSLKYHITIKIELTLKVPMYKKGYTLLLCFFLKLVIRMEKVNVTLFD